MRYKLVSIGWYQASFSHTDSPPSTKLSPSSATAHFSNGRPPLFPPWKTWGTDLRASSFPFLWLPSKMPPPSISWGPCLLHQTTTWAHHRAGGQQTLPKASPSAGLSAHRPSRRLPASAGRPVLTRLPRGAVPRPPGPVLPARPHIPVIPPFCPNRKWLILAQSHMLYSMHLLLGCKHALLLSLPPLPWTLLLSRTPHNPQDLLKDLPSGCTGLSIANSKSGGTCTAGSTVVSLAHSRSSNKFKPQKTSSDWSVQEATLPEERQGQTLSRNATLLSRDLSSVHLSSFILYRLWAPDCRPHPGPPCPRLQHSRVLSVPLHILFPGAWTSAPPSPPSLLIPMRPARLHEGLLTFEHLSLQSHFPLVYSSQCRAITRQLDEWLHVPPVCEPPGGGDHDVFIPTAPARDRNAETVHCVNEWLSVLTFYWNVFTLPSGAITIIRTSMALGTEACILRPVTLTAPHSHLGMVARTSLLGPTSRISFLLF